VTSVGEKEEKANTIQPPLLVFFSPSHIGSESANIDGSLSPSKTTTETNEPSVIQGRVNHYSGELPGETNLERDSDITSDEVMIESPRKQTPNS